MTTDLNEQQLARLARLNKRNPPPAPAAAATPVALAPLAPPAPPVAVANTDTAAQLNEQQQARLARLGKRVGTAAATPAAQPAAAVVAASPALPGNSMTLWSPPAGPPGVAAQIIVQPAATATVPAVDRHTSIRLFGTRRRHVAAAGRILATGLATSGFLATIAGLATADAREIAIEAGRRGDADHCPRDHPSRPVHRRVRQPHRAAHDVGAARWSRTDHDDCRSGRPAGGGRSVRAHHHACRGGTGCWSAGRCPGSNRVRLRDRTCACIGRRASTLARSCSCGSRCCRANSCCRRARTRS